jgi:hypothetical protein
MRPVALAALGVLGILVATRAHAQLDERLALTGGYAAYVGLRIASDPDFLAARNRGDLLLTFTDDRGRIVLRPRLTYDALTERLEGDLGEAFVDIFFDRVDLRLGHQIIAWGRTDGAFVTDLLAPLDLSEFFAQPFEDLRLGVTALQATVYAGNAEVTAITIPRRPTSRLPEPGSPWFPAPANVFGVPLVLAEPAPLDPTLAGSELATRLTWRGLPRTDVALLWMTGFNRIPAFHKGAALRQPPQPVLSIVVTPTYYRRQVVGLSTETAVLDPFVFRAEAAYHTRHLFDERAEVPTTLAELSDPALRDALDRGFLLEKPFVHGAIGIERTFGMQTFRLQGIGRYVVDHDPRVAADRFEPTATLLWLGRFLRETLTARTFGYYTLGKDYWVNPELAYAVRDGLNASVGGHVFGGPEREDGTLAGLLREPTFGFSAFDANDFVYLRVTYRF